MLSIEDIYKKLWTELINNTTLMELMGIEPYTGSYPPLETETTAWNTFISDCRHQIFEGQNSDDALTDTKTKIQISEGRNSITRQTPYVGIETDYYYIYSWVTKENNRNNRKTLKIADELINSLDAKKRQMQGLPPIYIGAGELMVYNRDPYTQVEARGWDCYGVIFKVSYIV